MYGTFNFDRTQTFTFVNFVEIFFSQQACDDTTPTQGVRATAVRWCFAYFLAAPTARFYARERFSFLSPYPTMISSPAPPSDLPIRSSPPLQQPLTSGPQPLTRPRIIIPAKSLSLAQDSESRPVITPGSSSSYSSVDDKEKIGRWSQDEHSVFLLGLENHGKQWKVIAGLIGTRTVVQVRTHAQKYFQRMERRTSSPTTATTTSSSSVDDMTLSSSVDKTTTTTTSSTTTKRKMSLPDTAPFRSKKLKSGGRGKPRASSLTLVSSASKSRDQEM
jgi:SHAQKYF class myb-like DNA-binding protein